MMQMSFMGRPFKHHSATEGNGYRIIMDAALKEKLTGIGVNVDEALNRMLGHEGLYIRLLKSFAEDNNHKRLQQALSCNDPEEAFKAAHTLKGLTGALSITVLFVPLTEITNALQHKNIAEAIAHMQSFNQLYNKVTIAINSI